MGKPARWCVGSRWARHGGHEVVADAAVAHDLIERRAHTGRILLIPQA